MYQIAIGTIIISVLHALIPSHWLPILSLSKSLKWTKKETLKITFWLGLSHVFGTVLLGILLAFLGKEILTQFSGSFEFIGPSVLIIIGLYFIYQHHTHHHFHVDDKLIHPTNNKRQLIMALLFFMLISPCIEVIAFFFAAGQYGIIFVSGLFLIYSIISLVGMVLWMNLALLGVSKMNWHKLEHNAGLITGLTITVVGVVSLF